MDWAPAEVQLRSHVNREDDLSIVKGTVAGNVRDDSKKVSKIRPHACIVQPSVLDTLGDVTPSTWDQMSLRNSNIVQSDAHVHTENIP